MNAFSGMDQVQTQSNTSSSYFGPGKYEVCLDKVILKEKRLGGEVFIVETTVMKSSNPAIRPGEKRSWVQSMHQPSALPRVKLFAGAAAGYDPDKQIDDINSKITEKACAHMVSEANPLAGKILILECVNKPSQKTGKPFTIHNWAPAQETRAN